MGRFPGPPGLARAIRRGQHAAPRRLPGRGRPEGLTPPRPAPVPSLARWADLDELDGVAKGIEREETQPAGDVTLRIDRADAACREMRTEPIYIVDLEAWVAARLRVDCDPGRLGDEVQLLVAHGVPQHTGQGRRRRTLVQPQDLAKVVARLHDRLGRAGEGESDVLQAKDPRPSGWHRCLAFAAQIPRMILAIRKYTTRPVASTSVLMNGALITAGSKPRRRASRGRSEPTSVATVQTVSNVSETTDAIWSPNDSHTGTNARTPSIPPSSRPTRPSRSTTSATSVVRSSPTARARVTVVADCDPAL